MEVLNYGGGVQTGALCILVAEGVLPRPDRIVIADTGREKPSTWGYIAEVMQPYLSRFGLAVEIAPRELAYVDLYAHNGDLLIPAYTLTGKLSTFCSNEWKARVVDRYLRAKTGTTDAMHWIGFSLDEKKRIKSAKGKRFPLIDLMLTRADCKALYKRAGLAAPSHSSCYMCPNMPNAEWREIRDRYPAAFLDACNLDDAIRAEDIERGGSGLWLHHSLRPLAQADLDAPDRAPEARQCGLGLCMV